MKKEKGFSFNEKDHSVRDQSISSLNERKNLRRLYCPRCGRFLAMEGITGGCIEIRCKKCKEIIKVNKQNNEILIII